MSRTRIAGIALLLGLLTSLHFLRTTRSELADKQNEIESAHEKISQLRSDLASSNELLNKLKGELSGAETRISSLANEAVGQAEDLKRLESEVGEQRKKTEEKRKAYQAMLGGSGVNPTLAAKIKSFQDDNQIQQNRIAAIDQELSNSNYDANEARSNARSSSTFSMSQEDSRVQDAQQNLNSLQANRAAVAKSRSATRGIQLGELDQQIVVARGNLNALKAERGQLQNQIKSGTQNLETQIRQNADQLTREKNTARGKVQNNNNEIVKIQSQISAQDTISVDRKNLLNRLNTELQEETDKLKTLEAKLREQRAKVDKVK